MHENEVNINRRNLIKFSLFGIGAYVVAKVSGPFLNIAKSVKGVAQVGSAGAPTTPTGVSAIPLSDSQVQLNWNPSQDDVGVAGYRVYRAQGATIATPLAPPSTTPSADAETDWIARSTAPGVTFATDFRTDNDVYPWVHQNSSLNAFVVASGLVTRYTGDGITGGSCLKVLCPALSPLNQAGARDGERGHGWSRYLDPSWTNASNGIGNTERWVQWRMKIPASRTVQPGSYWASAVGGLPAWLQVTFGSVQSITEIDVVTVQDNYQQPIEPTLSTTFSLHGNTDFQVQYWNGGAWTTVTGGNVTGNDKVWRQFTFAAVSTDKIRVLVSAASDGYARIAELEAWASGVNVALKTNGGIVTTSSDASTRFLPGYAANNNDRTGQPPGGWKCIIIGGRKSNVDGNSGGSSMNSSHVITDGQYIGFPRPYYHTFNQPSGTDASINQNFNDGDGSEINLLPGFDRGPGVSNAHLRYCIYNAGQGQPQFAGCPLWPIDTWITFKMRMKILTYSHNDTNVPPSGNEFDVSWALPGDTAWTPLLRKRDYPTGYDPEFPNGPNSVDLTNFETQRIANGEASYVLYDQLICSTQDIALPGAGGGAAPAPVVVISTQTQELSCPSGQTGTITQQRTVITTNGVPSYGSWSTVSNTCTAVSVSPPGVLPAWVPAAGTIATVGLNTVVDDPTVNPQLDPAINPPSFYSRDTSPWHEVSGIFVGAIYSGAIFAPLLGEQGSMVFTNSGHNGYNDNGVYLYDVATRRYARLTNPYGSIPNPFVNGVTSYGDLIGPDGGYSEPESGEYYADTSHTTTLPHQPRGFQSYDHNVYLPPGYGGAGAKGALLTTARTAGSPIGQGGGHTAHILDFIGLQWNRFTAVGAAGGGQGPGSTVSLKRREVYIVSGLSGSAAYLKRIALDTGVVTLQGFPGGDSVIGQAGDSLRYSELRDCLFVAGIEGGFNIQVIDLDTRVIYRPPISGASLPVMYGGGEWVEADQAMYYYEGLVNPNTVYKITLPAGDPKTGTWLCTPITLTGTPFVQFGNQAHCSRFRWCPAAQCFLWRSSNYEPMQAFRLP